MHKAQNHDLILDTVRMRDVLSGVVDQRGKIARMLERGELISLRRGLYATRHDLDPRCLAGPIYGPSYISFETALSWYGMIPEGVAEIRSATIKRTAHFENAFGRFEYLPIPPKVFPIGITRITTTPLPFLLASPTKALADRIAQEPRFRSMMDIDRWLTMMRIELTDRLDADELTHCAESYGRPSVRWLLRYAYHHHLFSR
jgi:predicted transcriptional regulator of viral defense system